jgi:protein phosphatase 4 regulatory subunit 3
VSDEGLMKRIRDFISQILGQLRVGGGDDALSDDALDMVVNPINLPAAELGNLPEIEQVMRSAASSQPGRDHLAKVVLSEDYILKLLPLVEMAEDLESLSDLHRLCNIMKTIILLNDTAIVEFIVTDAAVMGVVGALECKPCPSGVC